MPMSTSQRVSSLIAAAALSLLLAAASVAQDYPSRPIKMIVPFGAGGPTDIFTRLLAEELRKALGEPLVMENRPGAGTIIGTDAAAKSPPDGYTLLMMSATQTTTETLVPQKSYKLLRDFVPVASLLNSELVMVVHPSVKVKTLKEFIALAKANPGALNYASSGVGSNYHMAGELFKTLTATDILHVPYKGQTRRPERHHQRANRNDVRLGAEHGPDDPGRPGQSARHDRQGALGHPPRSADIVGSRGARLRSDDLDRLDGSGGHAAADRHAAQRGDQQNPHARRRTAAMGEAGR